MNSSLVFPKSTWDFHVPNAVLMQASSSRNYAFLRGKSGLIIYFYYLWSWRHNPMYRRYAEQYVEEMSEWLYLEMPIEFDTGITGIGWVIDHLIKKGFIEGDSDEILSDIDARIIDVFSSSSELSFFSLLSIAAYCEQRLQGGGGEKLRSLLSSVFVRLLPFADASSEAPAPATFDILWSFPWVLYLFGEGMDLGIEESLLRERLGHYRSRVENLLSEETDGCVGRMLYLLASQVYPDLPVPKFSESDLPEDISVHHGAAGLLLLMKLWGRGKFPNSEYEWITSYIRDFIKEYPYYLGLSVMGGHISFLDGTIGAAFALEL